MTKVRPPLTVENAMFRVLGAVGIDKACAVTGREAHYLRSVSDSDTRYRLSVDDAIQLDLAHQEAGHSGAPIYETYGLLLGVAHAAKFLGGTELARQAIEVIRESGEAGAALVAASLPGATQADLLIALKECEEDVQASTKAVAMLRHRIDDFMDDNADSEPAR